jgi:FkbM family methyltransferase
MTSYSHVDNNGMPLDIKLDMIFSQKENGFFIELGANDGLKQSNTAFLEFHRGWRGVLIEPSPNAFALCKQNRPNSICIHAACVSNTYEKNKISGDFFGELMSSIDGKRLGHENNTIEVNATTLESILDNIKPPTIDFLSLDAEGYELEILKGLNLSVYRPKYILIEIYNKDYAEIVNMLRNNKYELVDNISNYNSVDNPHWDGTHNDYLFIDTTVDN